MRWTARLTLAGVVAVLAMQTVTAPAEATWSIVGVDPETGQVGAAVASCVPVELLDTEAGFELIALEPGVGAGISQALYLPAARDEIARSLQEGRSAPAAIALVTDPDFDPGSALRQHAVVLVDGSSAAHTGSENGEVALDRQAENVSVQGNILTGAQVVDDALEAFVREDGRTLGDRLVDALEAGSLAGGDARCGDQTALFAHVAVADVIDMTTSVELGDGRNPVTELAELYRSGVIRTDTAADTHGGGTTIVRIGAAALALAAAAWIAVLLRRQRGLSRPPNTR